MVCFERIQFFLIRISIQSKVLLFFCIQCSHCIAKRTWKSSWFWNSQFTHHHHRLKSKTFTYFEFNFQIPCYYYLRIYSKKKKTRLRIQNGRFFFLFFSIHSSHINILVMAITNLRPILTTNINATTIERIHLCISLRSGLIVLCNTLWP